MFHGGGKKDQAQGPTVRHLVSNNRMYSANTSTQADVHVQYVCVKTQTRITEQNCPKSNPIILTLV